MVASQLGPGACWTHWQLSGLQLEATRYAAALTSGLNLLPAAGPLVAMRSIEGIEDLVVATVEVDAGVGILEAIESAQQTLFELIRGACLEPPRRLELIAGRL